MAFMISCRRLSTSSLVHWSRMLFCVISSPLTETPPALAALPGPKRIFLPRKTSTASGVEGILAPSPTQMQPLPTRACASPPLISFCVAHGSAIWHGTPQGRLPSKYLHLNCLAYSWMRPRLTFLSRSEEHTSELQSL